MECLFSTWGTEPPSRRWSARVGRSTALDCALDGFHPGGRGIAETDGLESAIDVGLRRNSADLHRASSAPMIHSPRNYRHISMYTRQSISNGVAPPRPIETTHREIGSRPTCLARSLLLQPLERTDVVAVRCRMKSRCSLATHIRDNGRNPQERRGARVFAFDLFTTSLCVQRS